MRTSTTERPDDVDGALGGRVVARHGGARDLHERHVADDGVHRADEDLVELGDDVHAHAHLVGEHERLDQLAQRDGAHDDDAVGAVLAGDARDVVGAAQDREAARLDAGAVRRARCCASMRPVDRPAPASRCDDLVGRARPTPALVPTMSTRCSGQRTRAKRRKTRRQPVSSTRSKAQASRIVERANEAVRVPPKKAIAAVMSVPDGHRGDGPADDRPGRVGALGIVEAVGPGAAEVEQREQRRQQQVGLEVERRQRAAEAQEEGEDEAALTSTASRKTESAMKRLRDTYALPRFAPRGRSRGLGVDAERLRPPCAGS